MPTQVVVEARKQLETLKKFADYAMWEHLVDLVEEYGDALLKVGRMGSESFRKGGSEVDPKACVDYALSIRDGLREAMTRRRIHEGT